MPEKEQIRKIIKTSLAYHNLNKTAELELGLTLVQYYLLCIIKDAPGAAQMEIAVKVGLNPSTLTQSLKRLLKKKFINVLDDPRDARKKIVLLNRHGYKSILHFESHIENFLRLQYLQLT